MFYYVQFTVWDITNYKFSTHYDKLHEDCTTYSGSFIYLGNDNQPVLNMIHIKRYCKKLMERHFDKWKVTIIHSHAVTTEQEMFTLRNGYYWNAVEITKQDYLHEVRGTPTGKYVGIEIFDKRSFLQKVKDFFKRTKSY